jgi:hypothetical protein
LQQGLLPKMAAQRFKLGGLSALSAGDLRGTGGGKKSKCQNAPQEQQGPTASSRHDPSLPLINYSDV